MIPATKGSTRKAASCTSPLTTHNSLLLPFQHLHHAIEIFERRVLDHDLPFSFSVTNPDTHPERAFQRALRGTHVRVHPARSALRLSVFFQRKVDRHHPLFDLLERQVLGNRF